MKQKNDRRGFSLAELLIVVAIIGALVAIAIPVFSLLLERSREAVDMSNMRNAYAVYTVGVNSGEIRQGETYYYDVVSNSLSKNNRPEGYGKAGTESNKWWNGNGVALGVPKNKTLQIEMEPSGNIVFRWGGAYAGLNVTNAKQYAVLNEEDKIERDLILLDTLQEEFRNMTYGQLHDLFFDEKNKLRPEFSGKSITGNSNQNLVQSLDGYICITIAESSIIDGVVNSGGQYHNTIYLPDLFQDAGYNISGNTNENYILNSVNGSENSSNGVNARLWVNLGISQSELQNIKEGSEKYDMLASNAYTYLKGAGLKTDSRVSQSGRSGQ